MNLTLKPGSWWSAQAPGAGTTHVGFAVRNVCREAPFCPPEGCHRSACLVNARAAALVTKEGREDA